MRGHILLSEFQLVATKGCKNAAGVPPDPRWSAGFLLGKPAVARPPEPTIFDKGLRPQALGYRIFFSPVPNRTRGPRAPGVWVVIILCIRSQPVPGGLGLPCCMNIGSGKNGNAGFPKRKPADHLGSGGTPGAFLPTFAAGDKLQHAMQKWVWPAGHLLSRRREDRVERRRNHT